ncbi:putative Ubiquitin 3 binding protein But2 C-terminal domain-containing protein [Seiridium cardinale]|uniref:Ubiquitin 3 binding protein But2 C-terminal domain-containing protein n=1 Tax=Seiridium cardinale TaxID=138064 RepID=A0ABR2Y8B0_9PEZI
MTISSAFLQLAMASVTLGQVQPSCPAAMTTSCEGPVNVDFDDIPASSLNLPLLTNQCLKNYRHLYFDGFTVFNTNRSPKNHQAGYQLDLFNHTISKAPDVEFFDPKSFDFLCVLTTAQTIVAPTLSCTVRVTAVGGPSNGQTVDCNYFVGTALDPLVPETCTFPGWTDVDTLSFQLVQPSTVNLLYGLGIDNFRYESNCEN